MGKLIGSALMTVGPAMAARTLDGPKKADDTTQEQMLATLREIAANLHRQET